MPHRLQMEKHMKAQKNMKAQHMKVQRMKAKRMKGQHKKVQKQLVAGKSYSTKHSAASAQHPSQGLWSSR